MISDILHGFIKIHILHHADCEPVYGLWLIKELGRHGYRLGPGTVYPLLRKMESEGLLVSRQENVDGRLRKYYRITATGHECLLELRKKVRELGGEVIE